MVKLSSPFGGTPRNWKQEAIPGVYKKEQLVPPSGGSLEIGNLALAQVSSRGLHVPPSGGSLEIGNRIVPTLLGN